MDACYSSALKGAQKTHRISVMQGDLKVLRLLTKEIKMLFTIQYML
jgi:hypothetical protein